LCPQNAAPSGDEKRTSPRFLWTAEIAGVVYSEFPAEEKLRQSVKGSIQNIGSGGIAMTSDSSLKPGTVLRCEISVKEAPVKIPTLLKVCWSKQFEPKGKFEVGLNFLL
jgi:PilZ domain